VIKKFEGFFSKDHDDIANKILTHLKYLIKNGDKLDIKKYADYKISITIKKEILYKIDIQKSGTHKRNTSILFGVSDKYVLVINNKHYDVSDSICKSMWNLLSKYYDSGYYDSDNIKNDFQ